LLKKFLAKLFSLAKNAGLEKVLQAALVCFFRGLQVEPAPDERPFVPGSATRVPAGRNCRDLFRGIVAAPARSEPTSETNPLREASLSQRRGRVAATRFVSGKIELP
jgi:hypothetical protein